MKNQRRRMKEKDLLHHMMCQLEGGFARSPNGKSQVMKRMVMMNMPHVRKPFGLLVY
jgi:hypothetical protein